MSTPTTAPAKTMATAVPVIIHLPHQTANTTVHVQVHVDDATFDDILNDYPEARTYNATPDQHMFRAAEITIDRQPTTIYGSKRDNGPNVEVVT